MTVNEIFSTIRDWAVGKFQPKGDYASADDLAGKLDADGDTAENTVSFTSEDATDPAEWTDVPVLENGETHSSLFGKISKMIRNIRYLWKLLGSTDISAIGDGTVTGAINTINDNLDGYMPLSGGDLTEGGIISPYGDLYMQSNGYDGWLSDIMDYIKSERNIKTYATLAQLGFTEPTTAAEIYAAMPSQSQALLIDTVVTDAPTDGGGATMLFVKQSTHRGFILASGKTSMTYIMHLNGTGGNPTGEWIPIPMYKPGKITVFATPIYYTQVDGKYEWSVAVNSPVFPADSTKIAVTALDIYGVAYITSPSYEIIENNGSGSLLIKFMFDNQRQASTWRIYFEIS